MTRHNISIGPFTLLVSICGEFHVAPGGIWISNPRRAERIARLYAGVMGHA